MVPGVPGYVPMRDRGHLQWKRADGSISPDWWEVGAGEEKGRGEKSEVYQNESAGMTVGAGLGLDFVSLNFNRW
jgi:hypothetical protein